MKLAFAIFEGMTALDFIGMYDPLTRLKTMNFLPDLTWDLCSFTPGASDDRGLRFTPTRVGDSLAGYDWLVVPGGLGTRALRNETGYIAWLKTAAACRVKASACTGSLLLGAAGFLQGKAATTHPSSFELLRPYCTSVVDKRIVDAGEVITARGVTSGIDLGLYLCEKLAGAEAAAQIREQMDYPYSMSER